ncbi:sucrase ferredoxin [Nocardioides korecus]
MPAPGPRGSARGRPLSAEPVEPGDPLAGLGRPERFRCSVAAEQRGDDLAGTATHVEAFLLVEHHGPWGAAVLRDSRLDADVQAHLSGHRGLKVLLVRRHDRARRGSAYAVMAAFPRRRVLVATTVADHRGVLDLDVAAIARGEVPDWDRVEGPAYAVCTHGKHDACCAERGRPVAAVLTGFRPDATWEVSHVGGDRFAANLLVLPEGLYYGRMDPVSAPVLADLHESGRLDLDRLRGRSAVAMSAQHAEITLRRHLGDDRIGSVRFVRWQGSTCVLERAGEQWGVEVTRVVGEPARLTCGAAGPGTAASFASGTPHRL